MQIRIENLILNYKCQGAGPDILLLHGWGQTHQSFQALADNLAEDYTVYALDLPGFGDSTIAFPLRIDDYVEIIHEFVLKLNLDTPILLGHSFGGRIAIKYAVQYPVEKLILVGTPGIKRPLGPIKTFKVWWYKLSKKMHIQIKMGSTDYRAASQVLRRTLVMAVNENLVDSLSKIHCETILIWGSNDKVVPVKIGKKMNKKIRKSGLVIIPHCGHFPFLEKYRYFMIVLRSFLQGERD